MQNQTVARRYATAIFALANEAGKVEAVGRALAIAVETLNADEDARRFFVSPVIDRAEKAGAVERTFSGRIDEIALHALLLLVRKRREALLVPIATEYGALALAQSGLEPLEIVSARPLSESEATEIVARLARVYGKRFAVTRRVDLQLLGGVRITMGDRRIDGSIAGRVDELARDLLAAAPQVGVV